jgi:hypothetical protein
MRPSSQLRPLTVTPAAAIPLRRAATADFPALRNPDASCRRDRPRWGRRREQQSSGSAAGDFAPLFTAAMGKDQRGHTALAQSVTRKVKVPGDAF